MIFKIICYYHSLISITQNVNLVLLSSLKFCLSNELYNVYSFIIFFNLHLLLLHILRWSLKICCLLLDRGGGTGLALKTLKRVEKGWGQGSISSLLPQKNDFLDYYDGSA